MGPWRRVETLGRVRTGTTRPRLRQTIRRHRWPQQGVRGRRRHIQASRRARMDGRALAPPGTRAALSSRRASSLCRLDTWLCLRGGGVGFTTLARDGLQRLESSSDAGVVDGGAKSAALASKPSRCRLAPVPVLVVRSRLKQFSSMNKFKKKELGVVAMNLPREEIDKYNQMFHTMDKDNDGNLSLEELKKGFRINGHPVPEEEIKMLLQAGDIHGNSTLDCDEFVTVLLHIKKMSNNKYLLKAFKFFDKDGNGFIEMAELMEALGDGELKPNEQVIITTLFVRLTRISCHFGPYQGEGDCGYAAHTTTTSNIGVKVDIDRTQEVFEGMPMRMV